MTAVLDTPNDSTRGWVVDVATHRVVRKAKVAARQDGGDHVSLRELNPLEDAKAAAKLLEGAKPLKALREALETGAELLEPAEADLRAMDIEEDTVSDVPGAGPDGHSRRLKGAHTLPDARELAREHPRA